MLLSRIKGFMYTSSKYHPDAGGGPRRHPRCVSKGVVPLLCALIIYPTSEGTTNLTRGTDERGWRDVLGALRGSALRRGLPPHERRRGHLRRGPHHRRGACSAALRLHTSHHSRHVISSLHRTPFVRRKQNPIVVVVRGDGRDADPRSAHVGPVVASPSGFVSPVVRSDACVCPMSE